ncbi:MAG: glycosyltransferase family 61 protein [Bacteroidia bacterium]|nr:glycosyltransferase family 61 protein [Bacteroidia bacterium]MDW8058077.1 glycosyltransferase family 61 protein [Bacteroidia bacterium]
MIPEAILIHHPWANNYSHWFIDCMPRLLSVRGYEKYSVLLPSDYQRFAKDTLEALGVKAIIPLERRFYYKVRRLILPDMPAFDSLANYYSDIAALRQRFLATWGKSSDPKLRIYLSRAKASRRKVINEQELLPVLSEYGFSIITTEGWSLAEQVSLFSQAEVLLSIHGAGLMNLLWMPEKSTIVEIVSASHVQQAPPLFMYANHARLYYYIAPTAPHSVKDIFDRADVIVNPEHLVKFPKEKKILPAEPSCEETLL